MHRAPCRAMSAYRAGYSWVATMTSISWESMNLRSRAMAAKSIRLPTCRQNVRSASCSRTWPSSASTGFRYPKCTSNARGSSKLARVTVCFSAPPTHSELTRHRTLSFRELTAQHLAVESLSPGLIPRGCRFVGILELDYALDLIVLQILGMSENDEFAEETQREHLQAEHDQQGGEQQRRPVRQRLMKKQPLGRHDQHQNQADRKRRHAHHAEKAQRLFGEAHQEEHREDVENTVCVFARTVAALKMVLGRLTKVDLTHSKALAIGQQGEKPVLIAIQSDLFEHAPTHHACAATEISQRHVRHPRCQRVKSYTPHSG